MGLLPRRLLTRMGKTGWVGYVVYTVALTAGLLYYRFPSDAIKAYLMSEAAALKPPMTLSIQGLRPDWPPWIQLLSVDLRLRDEPQEDILRADALFIAPSLLSLSSSAPRYYFRGRAYDGEAMGDVRLPERESGIPFGMTIRFNSLQIGLHSRIRALLGRGVTGLLSGEIRYAGPQGRFIDGEGEGGIILSDGKLTLRQPVLGMSTLTFDRLSAAMSLKDRKLSLSRVRLDGKALKGELSGTVMLNSNLPKSRLDLKGTMEPLGGLAESMKGDGAVVGLVMQGLKKLGRSFVIQGTLENPVFRFT